MYGFSWLKPAGCAKTMLGRREEEIEREEMERQLREAEIEEQLATQGEDDAMREDLRRQREVEANGGVVGGEEARDLDGDVPDADDDGEEEDDGEEDEDEEMEDGDLDDEIPDAEQWTYDTRREPDTDEEDEDAEGETGLTDEVEASQLRSSNSNGLRQPTRNPPLHRRANPPPGPPLASALPTTIPNWSTVDEDALANAMLDEDELGSTEHDLDADVPDGADRDLDSDIPDADADEDEDEWQHTDTELEMEESELDIDAFTSTAVATPGITSMHQTRSQTRRTSTSGNVAAGAAVRRRVQLVTPDASQDYPGPALSSNVAAALTTSTTRSSSGGGGGGGRASWLDASNARRNLFARVPSAGNDAAGPSRQSDIFAPSRSARNVTPPTAGMLSAREQGQGQGQGQAESSVADGGGGSRNTTRAARRLGAGQGRRGTENEGVE